MSLNYARGIPQGNNGIPFFNSPPAVKAISRYMSENATVSSVITLTADTTAIEISAGGTPVAMQWVLATDTQASVVAIAGATANFDHTIPSNAVRRFVVPIEGINNAQGYSSMVGANIANGLFRRVAYKTQGVASVMVTEYGSSNSY